MPKEGAFSDPYFPKLGQETDFCRSNLRIQLKLSRKLENADENKVDIFHAISFSFCVISIFPHSQIDWRINPTITGLNIYFYPCSASTMIKILKT